MTKQKHMALGSALVMLPYWLTTAVARAEANLDGGTDSPSAGVRSQAKGAANTTDKVPDNDYTSLYNNLQGQITDLHGQVDRLRDAVNGLPDDVIYIAAGLALVALILAVIGMALTISKYGSLRKEVLSLQSKVREVQQQNQNLLLSQQAADERRRQSLEQQHYDEVQAACSAAQPRPAAPAAPTAPQPPSGQRKAQLFAEAYNRLMQTKVQGMQGRQLKEDFLHQYGVQGISCTNYEQRMSNPAIAPQFQLTANPKEAQYWACPIGADEYAVVPCGKEYEAQIHITAGYKEVFDSNYVEGVYYHVQVLQPAIFHGSTPESRGRLHLER